LRKKQVRALRFQRLPAMNQLQPERAVYGIASGSGEAAALIGAALEFVVAPGPGDSESEREIIYGRMCDGGVEHLGSSCNGERLALPLTTNT
jgi:hypothetical protein